MYFVVLVNLLAIPACSPTDKINFTWFLNRWRFVSVYPVKVRCIRQTEIGGSKICGLKLYCTQQCTVHKNTNGITDMKSLRHLHIPEWRMTMIGDQWVTRGRALAEMQRVLQQIKNGLLFSSQAIGCKKTGNRKSLNWTSSSRIGTRKLNVWQGFWHPFEANQTKEWSHAFQGWWPVSTVQRGAGRGMAQALGISGDLKNLLSDETLRWLWAGLLP